MADETKSETKPQEIKQEEGYPSAYQIEIVRAEGFTEEQIAAMKPEQLEKAIKEQYGHLRRIWRSYEDEEKNGAKDPFRFFNTTRIKSSLALTPVFDIKNQKIKRLEGATESWYYDNEGNELKYDRWDIGEIILNTYYNNAGIIYEFRGWLNWVFGDYRKNKAPLLIVPVYEIPSGRIIKFKGELHNHSNIFEQCNIVYQDFEIKIPAIKPKELM